jgi:hypothetical protein
LVLKGPQKLVFQLAKGYAAASGHGVPTAGLMKTLEIEQIPVYLDDADRGAAFAGRFG